MPRGTVRKPVVVVRSSRPRLTWRGWHNGLGATIIPGGQALVDLNNVGTWPTLAGMGIVGDYTIRRIRFTMGVQALLAVENTAAEALFWGITVVEDDAFAAAAVAEPEDDPADWMGYGTELASVQGSFSASTHPLTLVKQDVKSMRKVNENHQRVVMVLEASGVNNGNIQVQVAGRMLVSQGVR